MKITITLDVHGLDPALADPEEVAHALLDEDATSRIVHDRLTFTIGSEEIERLDNEGVTLGYSFVGAEWEA